MFVYLNEISGLWNAIDTMYMSKRSWTREREQRIKELYAQHFDRWGMKIVEPNDEMYDLLTKLFKWAPIHITMGRFLDFSFTVEGIHRGAQDDFDSHAKRLDNRILRSSTRLAGYNESEISDWYRGKIYTTDEILSYKGLTIPEEVIVDDVPFIKAVNGYIRKDLADNKDVSRGLYMLSIPSNFVCKINETELAHIVKERDINSHAHPELKECIEQMIALVQEQIPQLTREFYYSVKN